MGAAADAVELGRVPTVAYAIAGTDSELRSARHALVPAAAIAAAQRERARVAKAAATGAAPATASNAAAGAAGAASGERSTTVAAGAAFGALGAGLAAPHVTEDGTIEPRVTFRERLKTASHCGTAWHGAWASATSAVVSDAGSVAAMAVGLATNGELFATVGF
jgi:hypothetical protein